MSVPEGHYSRKQLGCRSRVIAWSHAARFRMAARIVGRHPHQSLLDYGCGDGTFLEKVRGRFQTLVGTDLAVDQIEDCRRRFASIPNVSFLKLDECKDERHTTAYDVVTCMETLEHCTPTALEVALADLWRLCRRDGRVIISVPIEIGPTFVVKYALRTIAGWRKLSDYEYYERYSFGGALKMIFAGKSAPLERQRYGEPGAQWMSHHGFNWRELRERVRHSFHIEQTSFSPLGWLGGWFSSQAWFVCRPRSVD